MTELLELLRAMKSNAERERAALRSLDTRALFDLAAEGEGLTHRFGLSLAKVTPEQLASPAWQDARARAAEVKAMNAQNKSIASRSLEVVRALKRPTPTSDAPAFVSQHA